MQYETITKSELAAKCGVSQSVVKRWCNIDFFAELEKMGYKKRQRIFTPAQTGFLKANIIEFKE